MQDGRKWPFSWEKFFSLKSAWILACAFQFSRKNILLCLFLAEILLLCFVAIIVRALSSFFSGTKCKLAKRIQGNVLLLNWKAHAKLQAVLKEKNLSEKVCSSCTKPFNCIMHLITPCCLTRPTIHVCPIHVPETSLLLSLIESKFCPVLEMQNPVPMLYCF